LNAMNFWAPPTDFHPFDGIFHSLRTDARIESLVVGVLSTHPKDIGAGASTQ